MTNKIKNNRGVYVLASMLFIFIFMATNASAKLAFDNDCPVPASSNVNFSNGTAIFVPFTYNETNTTNSNLTIFLGTSTGYFCSAINGTLSTFAANRTVIFTPEFLNALKTSSCNATFESYMENYRKSGNILNSTGAVFCGIRNITFDSTASPSGITFNYPLIGYGNLTIGSYVYNGTQVKKYMIAYLMNNPDVALSGIVSTFANAVGINWSQGCNGITSLTQFFDAGTGNYTSKFEPSLLGINWTAGESLTPSGGAGGIFGWLLDYALGDQILPVITAANLSTNKIYVCGTVTLENDYSNSTVTTTNNATNVTSAAINTTLEIKTNASVTNATVEIVEYPENPQTAGTVGFTALNKYIGIRISSALENALSSVIIKVYYTDAEISGFDESTLRLYYYNETSSSWQAYDSPNGGVNTTENYVWANTTHFSDWGIFGTVTTSRGGHGGGNMTLGEITCPTQWNCSEWSACINGMQARACNDIVCDSNPISETRSCFVTPIISATIPTSAPTQTAPIVRGGPGITGAAIVPTAKPIVTLRAGLFSLIAALMIVGMISWIIIKKRKSKRRELEEDIKNAHKKIKEAKRRVKRTRKQEKKAEKRKRRK